MNSSFQPSEQASPPGVTWTCHVCGRLRPDEAIAVLSRDRSALQRLPVGTVVENIRYCRDNPHCVEGAKLKSFFPPYAPIDSSNQFGVGLSASGIVQIALPVPEQLSKSTALNLAAWLRVMADPDGREFERLLEEIEKGPER